MSTDLQPRARTPEDIVREALANEQPSVSDLLAAVAMLEQRHRKAQEHLAQVEAESRDAAPQAAYDPAKAKAVKKALSDARDDAELAEFALQTARRRLEAAQRLERLTRQHARWNEVRAAAQQFETLTAEATAALDRFAQLFGQLVAARQKVARLVPEPLPGASERRLPAMLTNEPMWTPQMMVTTFARRLWIGSHGSFAMREAEGWMGQDISPVAEAKRTHAMLLMKADELAVDLQIAQDLAAER